MQHDILLVSGHFIQYDMYRTICTYTVYYAILYCTILYYNIPYDTKLYYAILYYTILYYTMLYYTILRFCALDDQARLDQIVQNYTTLHYTILCKTILCQISAGTPFCKVDWCGCRLPGANPFGRRIHPTLPLWGPVPQGTCGSGPPS